MTKHEPSGIPEPKPMPIRLFRLMLIGTIMWAVAALVLGALAIFLPRVSLGLWPWISLAGAVLGALGMLWAHFNEDRFA